MARIFKDISLQFGIFSKFIQSNHYVTANKDKVSLATCSQEIKPVDIGLSDALRIFERKIQSDEKNFFPYTVFRFYDLL